MILSVSLILKTKDHARNSLTAALHIKQAQRSCQLVVHTRSDNN